MMKKLITIIGIAVLAFSTTAQTNLFNAREIGVAVGSGYVLDTSDPFQESYTLNFSGGLSYYLTRNLGIEAWVPFYTSKGVSVPEVQAGALVRFPLSREKTVFRNLAPYIGIGGVYSWETDSQWSYIGKVGTEFRLNSKWGTFLEGQYRNNTFDNWDKGQLNIFGGVKLIL